MKNKFILLVLFLPILCFSVDFESNRIYDNKNVTIDNFLYEKKLDKPLVFLNSEIENYENKIDVFLNEQQYYYRIINDDDSITQKIKIDKPEILEFLPLNSITIGLYNDDVSKPIIFENSSKKENVITLKNTNFNLNKNEWCIVDKFIVLPFDYLKESWEKSEKGLVRESISNFVANASNINRDFYNSVTNYFETNKATLLPKVSITNKCGQPVKVQIGDEKPFDLNRLTTTNIVNQPLFALFDNKPIKYWVTNDCPDSKCPITTNVFDQTFNKYNRDDYVITLKNIPLQKDVSYVSIANIPENAEVKFNGNVKELPRTNGIIKIQTNSHTNGSFVVEQQYYAQTNIEFTSGCINSTNTIACPELTPLDWQRCSITNTSKYPCDIKISYSNITNNVTIAPNSMTNYVLDSKSIDPIDVIFSWNTNTTTKTFKRIINNSINIEVQGKKEDPLDVFKKKYDMTDKTIRLSRNNIISQYRAIKDPFVDTKISTENLSNLCKKYVKEDVRVILSDDFAKALKLDKLSQDEINDIIKIVYGE